MNEAVLTQDTAWNGHTHPLLVQQHGFKPSQVTSSFEIAQQMAMVDHAVSREKVYVAQAGTSFALYPTQHRAELAGAVIVGVADEDQFFQCAEPVLEHNSKRSK